jgi:hypothetical protein
MWSLGLWNFCTEGARGGAVGWGTTVQARRSRVWFLMVSLTWSFWPHYGPEVDAASDRNEYQEYFLGGKGGQCVGLTTVPPSCADCLEIWEPQPPGTLRACPGLEWDSFSFYPLNRRQDGPNNRSEYLGKQKFTFPCREQNNESSHQFITTPTTVNKLSLERNKDYI